MEESMKKSLVSLTIGALVVASPAAANHIFNPGPYESRGACEAESAALSNDDRETLQARFPDLFSSTGEVSSFLTRAFSCEIDAGDGEWYLIDHRQEVLDSEWFKRRLRR
jgi:hypothetical protein